MHVLWTSIFQNTTRDAAVICHLFLGGVHRHVRRTKTEQMLHDAHARCYRWPQLFSSVQLTRSVVSDSATPWIAARQASLSITNSRSSLRLMSIGSVMPSSHLILCHPLLLLPQIPPSIRVFSKESTLRMRWPKEFLYDWEVFSLVPFQFATKDFSTHNFIYA